MAEWNCSGREDSSPQSVLAPPRIMMEFSPPGREMMKAEPVGVLSSTLIESVLTEHSLRSDIMVLPASSFPT